MHNSKCEKDTVKLERNRCTQYYLGNLFYRGRFAPNSNIRIYLNKMYQ